MSKEGTGAMTINLQKPDITELKPRITVFGVGGGGGNAVNNMINAGLQGVDFVVANTDAQALTMSKADRLVQLGVAVTEGLGAGSQPEVGRAAAEECIDEIIDHLNGTHMCFVTAGMGGGTGTGAAPVVAQAARDKGILTVGVVTKPFHFEGQRRMRLAEAGIEELQKCVDTLIVIPNQNLFRIANDKTTFADAFAMADQVLYSGVACITDLMVKEGLINLDFADVRSVMREMGRAMMGTGEASGEGRAMAAAEAAIANPLLDETTMKGAQGLLISITGGRDMTLFEVDEAATRIREEVDADANIILGATFDEALEGLIRVSVVATGIDRIESEVEQRPAMPASRPAARSTATFSSPGVASRTGSACCGTRDPAKDPVGETIVSVGSRTGARTRDRQPDRNGCQEPGRSCTCSFAGSGPGIPATEPAVCRFTEASAQPAPQRPAVAPLPKAPESRPAAQAAQPLRPAQ
jgi:cell division protein FtsZ